MKAVFRIITFAVGFVTILWLGVGIFSPGWVVITSIPKTTDQVFRSLELGLWSSRICEPLNPVENTTVPSVCLLHSTDDIVGVLTRFDGTGTILDVTRSKSILETRKVVLLGYLLSMTAFVLTSVYVLRPETRLGAVTSSLWILSAVFLYVAVAQEGEQSRYYQDVLEADTSTSVEYKLGTPWAIVLTGIGAVGNAIMSALIAAHTLIALCRANRKRSTIGGMTELPL